MWPKTEVDQEWIDRLPAMTDEELIEYVEHLSTWADGYYQTVVDPVVDEVIKRLRKRGTHA